MLQTCILFPVYGVSITILVHEMSEKRPSALNNGAEDSHTCWFLLQFFASQFLPIFIQCFESLCSARKYHRTIFLNKELTPEQVFLVFVINYHIRYQYLCGIYDDHIPGKSHSFPFTKYCLMLTLHCRRAENTGNGFFSGERF